MGDVVEMKRKVTAQIARFGHAFRVEFNAGRTPELSDPAAALYLDGTFLAWLTVGFAANDWGAIVFDMDDEVHVIDPPMLGMSPTTEEATDLKFLLEAEDNILTTLATDLGSVLSKTQELPEPHVVAEFLPDPRLLHPRARGRRVAAAWHDHGAVEAMLPDLVAVEVYDVFESTGLILADFLDEHDEVLGDRVREIVEAMIQDWRGGED
jgi:hypothetical protein